jgi:hypothetical protein
MRDALERVDVFFAHGPSARDTVIANGFPLERLREGVSPVHGTRPLPIAGLPSPRIGFAGRLHDDKATAIARVLSSEHAPPPPLRSFTERYEPARAADVYENTYRALIAPLDLALT